MARIIATLVLILGVALAGAAPVAAQGLGPEPPGEEALQGRKATGGAQTLEDIMARQRGENVPSRERSGDDSAAGNAAALVGQLRAQGGASDADVWTALRYNNADVTVSTHQAKDAVLVQDGGMEWLKFRAGPLREYGGFLLLGVLLLLLVFYLIRGRVRIEGGESGIRILRFGAIERFGHWLTAGSFVLLALTGLITLFGRIAIIPWLGHEFFSPLAIGSKWIHNNVAWAFMLGLVLIFVMWVLQNIPNRHDVVWLLKGGGLFSKGTHPPAKKFNAGQKIVFWAVIVLGASVSASGLSLIFPFDIPMFAKTFGFLNHLGLPGLLGFDALPETLTPHAEMQLSSIWHAAIGFLMMAVILGHIYIGTIGMEGAFSAMETGDVDLQWAKEHHNLWVEELETEDRKDAAATPAE